MKVGDLVKWESVQNDAMDRIDEDYGVIVKMSKTGHTTKSAQVLFTDGQLSWFDTKVLRVISESG
ncbi:MAG: hypothetical protein VW907_01665 [Opitutae bacterium]